MKHRLLLVVLFMATTAVSGTLPAGAVAPTFGIASSVQQIRPISSIAGLPTTATVTAARNESESFQIVVQGPATGVNVTGDLYGWNTTFPYVARWYDVVEPSDAEGGTGR